MGLIDKDLNKTAIALGKVISILNHLENKIKYRHDIKDYEDDFYLAAYICKVAILDRIEKNKWNNDTVVYIPKGILRVRKETISSALFHTVEKLRQLAHHDIYVSGAINDILIKKYFFYEYEKVLPCKFRESI